MGKAVIQDIKPDHQRFRTDVLLAKGARTLNQFAKDAGVNPSYLSQAISVKGNRPVTPSFIGKLACVADNGVTYEELMLASGFLPENHINVNTKRAYEKKVESEYNSGFMQGFYSARNYIFDILNSGAGEDIMSVALSNWKINERDMKLRTVQKVKMAITAGRIVADRETGEQYIILTPFRDNLWLAQSHFGEIKPIDVKDYELTIHRVPERYVSYILEKMKFSTAG